MAARGWHEDRQVGLAGHGFLMAAETGSLFSLKNMVLVVIPVSCKETEKPYIIVAESRERYSLFS